MPDRRQSELGAREAVRPEPVARRRGRLADAARGRRRRRVRGPRAGLAAVVLDARRPPPGASAHWAVDAALAPFSVAQLLARAQPDLGWHGDLQMTAQLHAAFDGQWHVAGQLARTSGDLSVSDLVQDPTVDQAGAGTHAALLPA